MGTDSRLSPNATEGPASGEVRKQAATPETVGGMLSSVQVTVVVAALVMMALGAFAWSMHLSRQLSAAQQALVELEQSREVTAQATESRLATERLRAFEEGVRLGALEAEVKDVKAAVAIHEGRIQTNSLALGIDLKQKKKEVKP